MSGRKWELQPPAGLQALLGPWYAAGVNNNDEIAARSEKAFFWIPKVNRWGMMGFVGDGSPDTSLFYYLGRHRLDQARGFFGEQYIPVPSSGNYARSICTLVVPDGDEYRLVVSAGRASAGTQNVLTCDNVGVDATFTARTGPFGSVLYGMTSMVWTGSAIVGVSSDNASIARSTNLGTSWSIQFSDFVWSPYKVVTDGMGTVLVRGQTNQLARSTDHGATWTTTTISGWSGTSWDACWFGGNFISMNTAGNSWISRDGVHWTAQSKVIRDPSMATATPRGVSHRSLVCVGQVLVAPWGVESGGDFTQWGILYSLDGFTWQNSGALGRDFAPPTSFTRELHLASSSPAHGKDPFSPLHQLCYHPGQVGSSLAFFSSVEFRGVEPVTLGMQLDEQPD
jgi:hypothetical protein